MGRFWGGRIWGGRIWGGDSPPVLPPPPAPKCGYLKGNEAMVTLLGRVKPEVRELKEKCVLVSPPNPLPHCSSAHNGWGTPELRASP